MPPKEIGPVSTVTVDGQEVHVSSKELRLILTLLKHQSTRLEVNWDTLTPRLGYLRNSHTQAVLLAVGRRLGWAAYRDDAGICKRTKRGLDRGGFIEESPAKKARAVKEKEEAQSYKISDSPSHYDEA